VHHGSPRTLSKNAFNRPTGYPDGTCEHLVYDRLDLAFSRDRLGRWAEITDDAFLPCYWVGDPLGSVTTFDCCGCGALNPIIDTSGNPKPHELTAFAFDRLRPGHADRQRGVERSGSNGERNISWVK